MDVKTHNLRIPSTVSRLGDRGVESLVELGFNQILDKHDLNRHADSRYPTQRKHAKAFARLITADDLDTLNFLIREARNKGIDLDNILSVRSSIARGFCTIRYS